MLNYINTKHTREDFQDITDELEREGSKALPKDIEFELKRLEQVSEEFLKIIKARRGQT